MALTGKDLLEALARDHDPVTGAPTAGLFAERGSDPRAVSAAKRIGRRAIWAEHTGRVYPVHSYERARVITAANVAAAVVNRTVSGVEAKVLKRAAKGKSVSGKRMAFWGVTEGLKAIKREKPYRKRSVIGAAARQINRGVIREVGDVTKITEIRDKGREFVNSKKDEGTLVRLGKASMRTAVMAPTLPSRSLLFLTSKFHDFGRMGEVTENLGTLRKRRVLGHAAASTAILFTGIQAYNAIRYGTGDLPDFSSPSELISATANTWGTAAKGAAQAPGLLVDTVQGGDDLVRGVSDFAEGAKDLWDDTQRPNGHKEYRDLFK